MRKLRLPAVQVNVSLRKLAPEGMSAIGAAEDGDAAASFDRRSLIEGMAGSSVAPMGTAWPPRPCCASVRCTRSFAAVRRASLVARCVAPTLKSFISSILIKGCASYLMRSASAFLISALACRAPSTVIDPMVSSASSGVTSDAIRASPTTLTCSTSPAAFSASRSATV